jgi:hypothetical protein
MRRRATPSPAMVVALIALFVALGGTGYAASGALSDGGSPTAAAARRHRRSLRGPRGFRGRTGATGATGPAGPQGPAGAQGPAGTAKAFAEVSAAGRVISGHASNISDANITRLSPGVYCFNLAAIGITTDNAAPVATPDWSDPPVIPGTQAFVVANRASNACAAGQVGVRTYDGAGTSTDLGFVIAFM